MPRWTQLLDNSQFVLADPATEAELRRAEGALGHPFPQTLRDLYLTTNGLFDSHGQWEVVWSLDRIVKEKAKSWAPPDGLTAFADNGAGEPFCIRTDGLEGISVWHPIAGETIDLAPDTYAFWEDWTRGLITT